MYVDRFEFVGGPLDGLGLVPDNPQDFSKGDHVGIPKQARIHLYRKRDDESNSWDYAKTIDAPYQSRHEHN